MEAKNNLELKWLKAILWTYIILCILIAGLNYGYAGRAPASAAAFISWFWEFYENWIKTLFIILGSFLTLRIVGVSKRTAMRKRNLMGLIITALVVHITVPFLLHNNELYFFAMPLPWTTIPLQMLNTNSSFYLSRFPMWGVTGITAALIFYVCMSTIVVTGTLLFGRRWQCSTLCLFNGFASEVFAPAFPLAGKHKKVKPGILKILSILRWFFFAAALFFTLYWVMYLLGKPLTENAHFISNLETYKYLSAELLMAMFFWIAFSGRGYCYYCPLGTMLGLLGKAAGQRIATDNGKCIDCGQCNEACPMSIDIQSCAGSGKTVVSLSCVGCGHCVDVCPTKALSYTTSFINRVTKKKDEIKITMHEDLPGQ